MKPLKDRILVKPIIEEKTESGIFLPSSQQKQPRGKIVAIGTGVTNCKEGDIAIYYENSGTPYTIGTEEHIFLRLGKKGYKGEVIAILPQP